MMPGVFLLEDSGQVASARVCCEAQMRVLALETSCDETAAAVVETANGDVRVLSSVVASQADLHARTAGVVPEVAARAHVKAIMFVINDALRQARIPTEKAATMLNAIAATTEPGLRPALIIGEASARALAVGWKKPFIPVNHLAGHMAAAWLASDVQPAVSHRFPAIVLIVSGGHTQLWRVDEGFQLRLLGQTRDDAAGEAFDKIARLLGLPYPGGAALAQLAERGDACEVVLPRPMIDSKNLDFSFSGLKTAVFYHVRDKQLADQERADIAASAQEAIVDVLVSKTVDAAACEGAVEVILTGGVAANSRLRSRLQEALGSIPLVVPHPQYCTDNAAMIGAAAVLGIHVPQSNT